MCKKCLNIKGLDFFCKDKRQLDGRTNQCKECKQKSYRIYVGINKDKLRKINKIYREKNKKKLYLYHKNWKLNNIPKMITCLCKVCNKEFQRKSDTRGDKTICSIRCLNITKGTVLKCSCDNCGKEFFRQKNKMGAESKHFCSQYCNGFYSSTNKTCGIKRSKLEIDLGESLLNNFKNLDIIFNNHEAINSELDIYIPKIKFAIELNGIFHYEPIFGQDKLEKIKNNDDRKFQACLEAGIELCVVNSSAIKDGKCKAGRILINSMIFLIKNKISLIKDKD